MTQEEAGSRLKEAVRHFLEVVRTNPGDGISALNAALEMVMADREYMKFIAARQGALPIRLDADERKRKETL